MSSSVHQLTSQNDANVRTRATGSTTHTALSATLHAASVSTGARRRGRPRMTEAQKAASKRRHAEAMRRKRRENPQLLAEQSEAKRQRQWSLYGSAVQVHGSGHGAQPCSSTSAGGTFMSSSIAQLTSQSDGNVQARATGCTTQTTLSAEGSGPCLSVATGDTFSSTSERTSQNDVDFQGQPTGCTTLSTLSATSHAASVSVSARRRGRPCLTEAQNAERKRRHAEAMRRKRRENPQLLAEQSEAKRQRQWSLYGSAVQVHGSGHAAQPCSSTSAGGTFMSSSIPQLTSQSDGNVQARATGCTTQTTLSAEGSGPCLSVATGDTFSSTSERTSQNDVDFQGQPTGCTTLSTLSATSHAASVSVSARRRGRPCLTEAQNAERKRRHAEAMRRKRRENPQLLAEQSEAKRQRQWSLYGSAVQVHGSGHGAQPCSSTSAGGTFMSSSIAQLTSQSDGNVQARATGCTTQTTLSAEGSGPCLSVATGDTFSSTSERTSQNDVDFQGQPTGCTTLSTLSATPHAASVSVSARRRGRPRLTEAQKAERKRRHAEAMRRKRRENPQLLAEQSEAKRQRQWSLYGSAVQVHGSGHAAQPCSSTSAGGTFMSSSIPQLTSQSDGNVQARATGCTTQTTLSAEGSGPCLSVATGDTFSSTSERTSQNDVDFQGQPTGCTTLSTLSATSHAASVSVSARRRGRPCLTEAQNAERKRRHAEAMRRKRRENPQLLAEQIEKKRQRRNADPEFRAREAMWRKRKEHAEQNVKKVEVNCHEGALLRVRKAVMKHRRCDMDPQLRAREADHKRQRQQNDAELRALGAEAQRRHRQDNPHTAARKAEERRQQRQENPDLRSREAEARRLWRRAEAEQTAWERLGQHVCRTCMQSIRRDRMPNFSTKNGLRTHQNSLICQSLTS
ncbi:uncharacterized protein LOC119163137 isoform X2 [Rhipicephalus microplus]|uniref:uncharacterized protein LOC119163137 isoform X2 n=1 Tax=Rhipicephalus microplus TaxID=6941 RepID=UPI003F6AE05E